MRSALPRSFYDREPVQVARDVLGKLLVRATPEGVTSGKIVEVEAYLAERDAANHAHRGQTRRNAAMFGPPGHAYVYAIHARYCFNVVTEPAGVASAVLIRAVEPLDGLELMARRRTTPDPRNLARGPARLCEAFAVDRTLDGWDLTHGDQLWVALDSQRRPDPVRIIRAPRVGINSAKQRLLRFLIADSSFVSKRPAVRSAR